MCDTCRAIHFLDFKICLRCPRSQAGLHNAKFQILYTPSRLHSRYKCHTHAQMPSCNPFYWIETLLQLREMHIALTHTQNAPYAINHFVESILSKQTPKCKLLFSHFIWLEIDSERQIFSLALNISVYEVTEKCTSEASIREKVTTVVARNEQEKWQEWRGCGRKAEINQVFH